MNTPLVSILMPVHNSQAHLKEAIGSILAQTYQNYEFIIIDDGSTDGGYKLAQSYKDKRIKLLRHANNRGIVVSLNEGIRIALGKYIVRMDGDDISLPERVRSQVSYMEKHPQVGVCGSWIEVFGKQNYIWRTPTESDLIKTRMFFESSIAHPSAIIRKSVLDQHRLTYDSRFQYVEDYKLWWDISKYAKLANIPQVLLRYRTHNTQIGRQKTIEQKLAFEQLKNQILIELVPHPTRTELNTNVRATDWSPQSNFPELQAIKKWYEKLLKYNRKRNIYNRKHFIKVLAERWVSKCYLAKSLGPKRYAFALTSLPLLIPSLLIVISIKASSARQYLSATIKRFSP